MMGEGQDRQRSAAVAVTVACEAAVLALWERQARMRGEGWDEVLRRCPMSPAALLASVTQ